MRSRSPPVAVFLVLAITTLSTLRGEDPANVHFNRDIRPILSDHCFQCHGPDSAQRDSELRLDTPDGALADLGGYRAVVPGDQLQSELYRRITATDPDERMPPPSFKRSLSPAQIELLRKWIQQGASRSEHWSFILPERAASSEAELRESADWSRNGIDQFIYARLRREGLSPSQEAPKTKLARRVALDLTGLPPKPNQVAAYLADERPDAFDRMVDRLLSSVHYGERMALPWLDAARYADSAGYQNDFRRTQWPWRDWVIRAYNANLPFDHFTRQQLAGDLFDKPTEDHLLATAFNRNHRINNEGGIIPDEFLVEYVCDRVETTSTVWLGLTVGCARCHDHKYDPIPQKDYYRMFAFFNGIPERGKDGESAPRPNIPVYAAGTEDHHVALTEQLDALEQREAKYATANKRELVKWMRRQSSAIRSSSEFVELPAPRAHLAFDFPARQRVENLARAKNPARVGGKTRMIQFRKPGHYETGLYIRSGGYLQFNPFDKSAGLVASQPLTWSCWVRPAQDLGNVEGPVLSCVTPDDRMRGMQLLLVDSGGNRPYRVAFRFYADRTAGQGIELVSRPLIPRNEFAQITLSYDGSLKAAGVKLFVNGEPAVTRTRLDHLPTDFAILEDVLIGAQTESTADTNVRDEELRNSWVDDVLMYSEVLTDAQIRALHRYTTPELILAQQNPVPTGAAYLERVFYRDGVPQYQALQRQIAKAKSQLEQFENRFVTYVSVMEEMERPRDTYLLERGVYDRPDRTEKLSPGTFAALAPMRTSLPRNRLGLADWLLDQQNPLTARVAVNRYWQMHFGGGLVRTPEDFGSQGLPPSHPRLLDWLAIQFRESGWDIKAMQRLIVCSATYRQQSKVTPALQQRDPENQLLARGPRFRLYGQALRDQALAAAGLLLTRVGGPPVMPYQPAGLWEEVSAKGYKYVQAEDASLYRRSLYTFWRRTVPPPSMMNFDSSSRESCTLRTTTTNTPLQALNLLNDPTFVEAARGIAQRMLTETGSAPADQIRYAFRLILARDAQPQELEILLNAYQEYIERFTAQPDAAQKMYSIGWSRPIAELDPVRLAAAAIIAATILNLDEAVTTE